MGSAYTIEERRLRKALTRFLSARNIATLPNSIQPSQQKLLATLERLTTAGYTAYLFGGLLRHLLFRKRGSPQPRDVDLVVDCSRSEDLHPLFSDLPVRVNRFGGLRITGGIPIDVWALPDTWAFKRGYRPAQIDNLPFTTYFNVEAAVAALNVQRGRPRTIFSAGFFEGLGAQTLDINLADNPHPALCVVRTLILARQLDFWISLALAEDITQRANLVADSELESVQLSHYGIVHFDAAQIRNLLENIKLQLSSDRQRILLPGSSKSQTSILDSNERDLKNVVRF